MKKFEELTMEELKALYDEKVKQEAEKMEEKPIMKEPSVIYAQSKERIQEFIDKIGEDDFIKYVLEMEE